MSELRILRAQGSYVFVNDDDVIVWRRCFTVLFDN